MAKAIITLKIMPESPDVDLKNLEEEILSSIESFCGEKEYKTEIEPIAFGLKAIKITFVMDESRGSTDKLEETISGFEGVNSVDVVDVRRAIG